MRSFRKVGNSFENARGYERRNSHGYNLDNEAYGITFPEGNGLRYWQDRVKHFGISPNLKFRLIPKNYGNMNFISLKNSYGEYISMLKKDFDMFFGFPKKESNRKPRFRKNKLNHQEVDSTPGYEKTDTGWENSEI